MGSAEADNLERSAHGWKRWLARAGLVLGAIALVALGYVWLSRERIAGDLIDDYLAQTGLEASYDIVSIGAQRQVIANIVIGDPEAPDLTIDRVSVDIAYGLGAPGIGAAVLERPRLFGTYREGVLSFGALDPLLFGESETETAGLPAIDLTLVDGGALLETDYGDLGAHLEGSGALDDGFSGKLALISLALGFEGCGSERFTGYGALTTKDGAPRFEGPLRLRGIECEGARIASVDVAADLGADSAFAKLEGGFEISADDLRLAQSSAQDVRGSATLSLREDALVLDHDVSLGRIETGYASLSSLRADGALRSARGFSQSSWNAQVDGVDLALAPGIDQALGETIAASEDTFLAPILAKLQRNLKATLGSARMSGDVTWRSDADAQSVVVPQARLRGAGGETVLALSRLSWSQSGEQAAPRLVGNFLTGGAGLPQITGRLEQEEDRALALRMTMAPYSAGADSLALPGLSVRQQGNGAFAFAGKVSASGAIPGGAVNALSMPLEGRFDARKGLRLGTRCQAVRFASLSTYDLELGAQSLRVCPADQRAMVSYRDTLDLAIAAEDLALEGAIAESPSRIAAARAELRYPGGFAIEGLAARIGAPDNGLNLTSQSFTGGFEDGFNGAFSGGTAKLDAVTLDLNDLAGRWSYEDGAFSLADTRFTLIERINGRSRFEPLSSEGAVLTLKGNDIAASAQLNHLASGTPITSVAVAHDLGSGEGSALLGVDAITFGPSLGFEDLTYLAKGVIAFAQGSVSGEGRIAWTSDLVTSTGAFRSDDLDLAAAFGPVQGLKGEVRFSDLLNLTTEPSQVIEIGSINPGIEALAGKVRFSLTNGEIIEVEDGRWPFMGGELIMRPTTLEYGTDKEQRYTFEIIALDAATFVTQMELTNLGASGTFDGTVPIVFDALGNGRIEGGLLISRQPGGNVSYIGELTYEDMGAMSNFAFQSLRSLDYRQMSVELEGDLAGEIITRFGIDGVRQGEDASQNFVTRRLAKLPIRFNINVRSENFYELATMVRSFWDPDALGDPVDRGVLSSDGTLLLAPPPVAPPPIVPPPPVPAPPEGAGASETEAIRPDEPSVQPPESESVP